MHIGVQCLTGEVDVAPEEGYHREDVEDRAAVGSSACTSIIPWRTSDILLVNKIS